MCIKKAYEITCDKCGKKYFGYGDKMKVLKKSIKNGWIIESKKSFCSKLCSDSFHQHKSGILYKFWMQ
jgi:hypothetical protein